MSWAAGRESDEVRNACFHLVEEHEEDITGLLYDNWDDDLALRRRICVDMVDGGTDYVFFIYFVGVVCVCV